MLLAETFLFSGRNGTWPNRPVTPQTINLYDGFVCHDAVVVVAVTTD